MHGFTQIEISVKTQVDSAHPQLTEDHGVRTKTSETFVPVVTDVAFLWVDEDLDLALAFSLALAAALGMAPQAGRSHDQAAAWATQKTQASRYISVN